MKGIIACLLASFIVSYMLYSFGGAIKDMRSDLGITNSEALWMTYVPIVTTIAWNPIATVLANRYGKKTMMFIGLGIMLATSIIPLFVFDFHIILVSRGISGIGMAFVYVSAVSILTDLSGDRISTTSGLWESLSYVGEIAIVCLGYLFAHNHGWKLMTLIIIPFIVLTLILMRGVPDTKESSHLKVSVWDHTLFNLSTFLTIVGLATAPVTEWGPYVLTVGIVLLVVFVWRQRKEENRLFDSSIFGERSFKIAVITGFVFFTTAYTVQQLLTNYIQISQIEGMLAIGTVMINIRLVEAIVLSPIFSTMSKRYRDSTFPMIGIICAALSIISLALLPLEGNIALAGCIVSCILLGIASALFIGPNMSVMMTHVKEDERNSASSINNLIRQVCKMEGAMFIILFLSCFAESEQAEAFEIGFVIMAIVCAVLSVGALYAVKKYRERESCRHYP